MNPYLVIGLKDTGIRVISLIKRKIATSIRRDAPIWFLGISESQNADAESELTAQEFMSLHTNELYVFRQSGLCLLQFKSRFV